MSARADPTPRSRRLWGQEGLTVIEVMVAAMILVVGALAVLGLVGTAAHNSFRSEQTQVLSNRLQQEMEQIKDLPYEQVALTSAAPDTSDQRDPRWRVNVSQYAVSKDGNNPRPMVYNGTALYDGGIVDEGTIDPTPIPFQSGDVKGKIYRFVVWEDDPSCLESQCPGAQDLKRVVVAVSLDDVPAGGERAYQEIQAQITDPDATPVDNTGQPPGGDDTKPWTFWLTDTTCNNSDRVPIPGDHVTHNTRGSCSSGLQNGNNPGAPDLLLTSAPVFNPEAPLHDFATDVEPPVDPELDKGLQLRSQGTNGCPNSAFEIQSGPDQSDSTTYQKVHKWVSPPAPAGTDVLFDGTAVLDLWTQTVNNVAYSGKLCIWLFIRRTNIFGIETDIPMVNQDPPLFGALYFTYSLLQWPTSWSEIRIPLRFPSNVHMLAGDRLGVEIGVERQGTGAGNGTQGLQVLYDEPSFDSRLEIKTHSTLPTF